MLKTWPSPIFVKKFFPALNAANMPEIAVFADFYRTFSFYFVVFSQKNIIYSSFTLTWLIVNDFQVEVFSFNLRKQWKLSVCKKDINQVRVNALYNNANHQTWLNCQ